MLNKVLLIGRLGKDPEVKDVNGKEMVRFSVATTENYKDRDGNWQEKTEWHNVAVWGRQADACSKYIHKGSLVHVEGRIRSWRSETGKTYFEINAQNVKFLDPKPKSEEKSDYSDDLF